MTASGVSPPLSRTDRAITLQKSNLKHQDFHNSRRREFHTDTEYRRPRAFGTRSQFRQPRFEAPSGPPIGGVVKWFSPEKGFGFVELSDGSGDAFLHGSVLAQSGIDAVQPDESLEVFISPGHTGPHVTDVLSVDTGTAAPPGRRKSNFYATTSNQPTSEMPVEA